MHLPPFSSFKELLPKVTLIVGHNFLGYDLHALNRILSLSISYNICLDTLVVSRFLNFGIDGGHSLGAWGQRLGLAKGDFSDFSRLSTEMVAYCKQDVEINYALYKRFEKYYDRFKGPLETEHRMAYICWEINQNGFYFDKPKALQYKAEIEQELEKLDADIRNGFPHRVRSGDAVLLTKTKSGTTPVRIKNRCEPSAGLGSVVGTPTEYAYGSEVYPIEFEEFNPASPKQIVQRLNEAGWKPVDKTKGHLKAELQLRRSRSKVERAELEERLKEYAIYGWKVNEENLETLPEDAPEAAKSLAKRILLASRLSSLKEWLNATGPEDQRVHGNLFHIGAWTQRMSHDSPNTANIPSTLNRKGQVSLYGSQFRSLWTVPDGRKLVGVDAEGIQLRILAHYIDDPVFTDGLISGDKKLGTDVHSLNAKLLSTAVPHGVGRDIAKTFIYSWVLGAGEGKTAEVLGCTLGQARAARDQFLAGYPGLKRLRDVQIPADASRGYFEGLDGRYVVCDSEHLMLAGYLQNGEAVVMKMANIIWREKLLREKVPFWQVNFVHDEWQTETIDDDDVANYIADVQCQSIVDAGLKLGLKCPLAGSKGTPDHPSIGYNWLETH